MTHPILQYDIETLVWKFSALKKRYRNMGACDSEVVQMYHECIDGFFEDGEIRVPQSAEEWGLYENMEDADKVSSSLSTALLNLLTYIKESNMKKERVKKHLNEYHL